MSLPVSTLLPHDCPHCGKLLLIRIDSNVITEEEGYKGRKQLEAYVDTLNLVADERERAINGLPTVIAPQDVEMYISANLPKPNVTIEDSLA